MTDKPDTSSSLKEPHLIDMGNVAEIAQWILMWAGAAAAGGIVEGAAYDLLRGLKRRFGGSKIRELKESVHQAMQDMKQDPNISEEQIEAKVTELFKEFE